MYSTVKSFEDRLVNARLAITNALAETDIKEALAELGFDEAKLKSGLELVEKSENLYQDQKRGYSRQFAATEEFNQTLQEAEAVYKKYATAAKLALLDAQALKNSLGLNEGRQDNIPDWLTQARLFYMTAMQKSEVLDELKEFFVTEENLKAGLELVNKAQELHNRQQVESSDARQTTKERDAAFAQLSRFMYKFNKIARVLLAGKPKEMEKLGIPERRPRTRKKKQETGEPQAVVAQPQDQGIPAGNEEKAVSRQAKKN